MKYFLILLLLIVSKAFASGGQLLNSTFFPNPAETYKTKSFEFIGGNLFFVPNLTFRGKSYGQTGTANSYVYDPIPYTYLNYRVNDKLVIGMNMLPSIYGDLSWPGDSIVARDSVITNVLFYRSGVLASYQITSDLVLGLGFNLEREYAEVSFVSSQVGFERNKSAGYNYITDVGIGYKLTNKDRVSLVYYSPVRSVIKGVSRAGKVANYNYATLKQNASLTSANLEHKVNDYWDINGAVYFSKWSAYKKIELYNMVSGNTILPAYWRDVWSFLFASKHKLSDSAVFGWDVLYETNPMSSVKRNYVGFPLAAAINFSTSFEYNFYKGFYVKAIGSYGTFAPNARINNMSTYGTVSANIYTGALEGSYRI